MAQQEVSDSICNEDLGGKCTLQEYVCGTPSREDLCGTGYKCCIPSVQLQPQIGNGYSFRLKKSRVKKKGAEVFKHLNGDQYLKKKKKHKPSRTNKLLLNMLYEDLIITTKQFLGEVSQEYVRSAPWKQRDRMMRVKERAIS